MCFLDRQKGGAKMSENRHLAGKMKSSRNFGAGSAGRAGCAVGSLSLTESVRCLKF